MSELVLLPPKSTDAGAPIDDWIPTSCADVVERIRLPAGGFCARPVWLQQYVDVLDAAVLDGNVYATCSAPPQHGKSLLGYAAIIFAALVRPGRRHVFCSYAQSRADLAAVEIEAIAHQLGLDPRRVGPEITMRGGTHVTFTSVEGSVTGRGVDGLALVDDPVKGSEESRSPTVQRKVTRWFAMDLNTRLHPPSADGTRQGASLVVTMTRWQPEDLIGQLRRDAPEYVHLRIPAITDDVDAPEQVGRELGSALWPEERSLDYLSKQKKRIGNQYFSAQYQGIPVPDEERIFDVPPRWTVLPANGRRWGYGIDTAGSAKQTADFNVAIEGCAVDGVLYVTEYSRKREELTRWVPGEAAALCKRHHAAVVLFGSSAGDNVAVSLFQREGVNVHNRNCGRDDKLVRARKYGLIELWAQGKVMFPEGRRWDSVIEECMNFTGVDGPSHDDVVDALVGLIVAVRLMPMGGGAGGAPFMVKTRGLYRDPRFPSDHRGDRGGGEVLFDAGRDQGRGP